VIADVVGVGQSTISRELKRNTGQRGYREKQAQTQSNTRRKKAEKAIKMTPNMIPLIEEKLEAKWSPEQISGWIFEERGQRISYEAIYLYIWEDKRSGGGHYSTTCAAKVKLISLGAASALVTIVERKTKFTVSKRIDDKTLRHSP